MILHEVRNPLQTARAFIQTMENLTRHDHDFATYFPLVLSELDRAEMLLKDYLRFTRQEASEATLEDVVTLCKETVMLVKGGAKLKEIELEEDYPQQTIKLMLDAQRIRQVLLNLLLNAFDACTAQGKVKVSVVPQMKEVLIRVQDNGCGMDKSQLERIFDPFFTTKTNGTGLGLSLCHKIIHRHGGYIAVHSQVGEGTTFTLVLPRFSVT